MNRLVRMILAALGVIAGLWLVYRTADRMYLTPRRALLEQIASATVQINRYNQARQDRPRLMGDFKAMAEQTLGSDLETVDHRLRSRLNRLAEHAGIANASVGTQSAVRRQSPARVMFKGNAQRGLREEIDFIELPGSIICQGTYEQILRLIASIENEPWIKRIDQVKFDPRDNGGRFDITLRLTTLFLPSRGPSTELATAIPAPDLNAYAAFVQTNPFRIPPLEFVATRPPPQTPTGFPYEQWALTGVAESPAGPEAWLLNNQTSESRRLAVGESLQDAVFTAVNGDSAEFTLGEQRFIVNVGQNLNDRNPLNH